MAFVVDTLPYSPSLFVLIITALTMASKKIVAVLAQAVHAVCMLWQSINWEIVRGICCVGGIVLLNVGVVVLVVISDSSYSG